MTKYFVELRIGSGELEIFQDAETMAEAERLIFEKYPNAQIMDIYPYSVGECGC